MVIKINFLVYKSIYKLQLEKYFMCQYEKSMIVLQIKNVLKFLTILQMDISRHFCFGSNFGNLTGDRKKNLSNPVLYGDSNSLNLAHSESNVI